MSAPQTPATVLSSVGGSDARTLRNLLGQFATGVTVITTRAADGRRVGMTANSFSSVSLEPPLVLWSLSRNAPSLPDFVAAGHFAIHVLERGQHGLSNRFARPADDKFAGLDHGEGPAGIPLLEGAVATLVCRNSRQYDGGDHLIFIGEIEQFGQGGGEPLLFHAGRYRIAVAHPDLED
ncbi:flavin reductase family protein [Thauera sinica]|uniref:Flavin reductase family protein n=1 Tax=Thauera sinica TaxID=2665146 RepID=A0ABW1ARP2_9RHOO|nr:flavin reductase family protein [Thauera sp. K11]ATE62567.1 flavin reductase [Thauera sp. K11]